MAPLKQRAGFLATTVLTGLFSAPASAAVLLIDDFSTNQGPMSVSPMLGPQTDSSVASGAGIIGGERDMVLSTDAGSSVFSSFAQVAGGVAQLADNTQFQSDLLFQWDGGDNDPFVVDVAGLGSVDLTADGNTAFEIGLVFNDLPATLAMTVYSTDGDSSLFSFPSAGLIFTDLSIYIPFTLFVGDADFSDVGAIELMISSPTNGLDIALDYIQTGITPVPLPASIWMFSSAMALFSIVRRRDRRG